MDTKKLDKILELNKKGLSLREIALVVKMSQEGVRNVLQKYEKLKVVVLAKSSKIKK